MGWRRARGAGKVDMFVPVGGSVEAEQCTKGIAAPTGILLRTRLVALIQSDCSEHALDMSP